MDGWMEDLGGCIKGRGVSPGHLMNVILVMVTPDLWERPKYAFVCWTI